MSDDFTLTDRVLLAAFVVFVGLTIAGALVLGVSR